MLLLAGLWILRVDFYVVGLGIVVLSLLVLVFWCLIAFRLLLGYKTGGGLFARFLGVFYIVTPFDSFFMLFDFYYFG